MKIADIAAVPKTFKLKKPFRFAVATISDLPHVLVRITSDTGITGYGECPVWWDPTGETQNSTLDAIRKMTPHLVGREPTAIEEQMSACDAIIYGDFAAKCGLDMALFDLTGKACGMPVHQLLNSEKSNSVPCNALIDISRIAEARSQAFRYRDKGFTSFKVKVGIDLEREIAILEMLREVLGDRIRIFVDANQGWKTAEEALAALERMNHINLAWVEQPVPAHDLEGLKRVTDKAAIPVMADESLYSPEDAKKMAEGKITKMFNIKLAKSGGLMLGGKIADIARQHNIPCVLGSMCESPVAILAGYHFARAFDLVTTDMYAYTMIEAPYPFGLRIDNGHLYVDAEHPGLGYPPDTEVYLEREFS
jgi:L-alanine-DL-glutamate epimerase-like enolase superfamily enzyme